MTEQLVDCSGGTDFTLEGGTRRKLDAMWKVLQQHEVPRTIVFCNKIETCRKLENFISRHAGKGTQIDALAYHAGLTSTARAANLSTFLRPPQLTEPRRILVCTDRCAVYPDATWTFPCLFVYDDSAPTCNQPVEPLRILVSTDWCPLALAATRQNAAFVGVS